MGVGVAILAVNIIDAPGRVLYVTSAEVLVVARTEFLVPTLSVGTRNGGWIKRYDVSSFFGYFIMKDKGEFLNKSEKWPKKDLKGLGSAFPRLSHPSLPPPLTEIIIADLCGL